PALSSTLIPYTTLFRSFRKHTEEWEWVLFPASLWQIIFQEQRDLLPQLSGRTPELGLCRFHCTAQKNRRKNICPNWPQANGLARSEEHTSELQSRENLV